MSCAKVSRELGELRGEGDTLSILVTVSAVSAVSAGVSSLSAWISSSWPTGGTVDGTVEVCELCESDGEKG